MEREDEDDAWRAIVENYGERPRVELPQDSEPARAMGEDAWDDDPDDATREDQDGEGFVAPAPPPLPPTTPDRRAAWAGLFGAPALLLVMLLLGRHLPTWLGYLLVAWFVGGFLYLIVQMPREPRDPGDDGARL